MPQPEPARDLRDPLVEPALDPAGDTPENRQIDKRHQQRGRQHEDQRHRQHAHELPRNPRPEQHWQERAKRRRGGTGNRPEHPLGRVHIGVHRAGALIDPLVGIFDHHDSPIDQHADSKDQPEHDHVRDGDAHHRQHRKAQQERCGDRESDQQGRANAQCGQHHDHHQRNGGQHRSLKLTYHGADDARLVVRRADLDHRLQFIGPAFAGLGHRFTHQIGRVDDVETLALDHLQRDGCFAVEPRGAGAILEGQVDRGQLTQQDLSITVGLDRQPVDIARLVKRRRDLDRETATLGGDFARRDQLVVVTHHIDQFAGGDVVGFQAQRVDDDLHHLLAAARDAGLQHGLETLQTILQLLGKLGHHAFGYVAGEVHDNDREFREIDLVDHVFLGACRKFGLGGVHRVADVGHGLGLVPAKLEFQSNTGVIFGRRAGHLVQPVEIAQLGLHDLDQQFLAVLGGNPREGDRHEERRDIDIRLAFLGQADIGHAPRQQREHHEGDDHPGPGCCPIN